MDIQQLHPARPSDRAARAGPERGLWAVFGPLAPYLMRTDITDLAPEDEDRTHVFGDISTQWAPHHWVGLRLHHADDSGSLPDAGETIDSLDKRSTGDLTWVGIEANGDIKGCPSLPSADYVGGNIRDHSLRTIWEQTSPLRFTRDRTVDDLWGYCRDCYYNDACYSGCSWTSHVLLGRPGNNPYCHHRALELLAQGKRERIERAEPAPGKPFDHAVHTLVDEDWPADELARRPERSASE